jgi:hypothetical protein
MSETENTLRLLEPLVVRMARRVGPVGITIADVRDEAERLGLLAADASLSLVSALGALPSRLGLSFIGYRKSHRKAQHGRVLRVWAAGKATVAPEREEDDCNSPYR